MYAIKIDYYRVDDQEDELTRKFFLTANEIEYEKVIFTGETYGKVFVDQFSGGTEVIVLGSVYPGDLKPEDGEGVFISMTLDSERFFVIYAASVYIMLNGKTIEVINAI